MDNTFLNISDILLHYLVYEYTLLLPTAAPMKIGMFNKKLKYGCIEIRFNDISFLRRAFLFINGNTNGFCR